MKLEKKKKYNDWSKRKLGKLLDFQLFSRQGDCSLYDYVRYRKTDISRTSIHKIRHFSRSSKRSEPFSIIVAQRFKSIEKYRRNGFWYFPKIDTNTTKRF